MPEIQKNRNMSDVDYLKCEIRSYNYLVTKIQFYNDELTRVANELQGVSSPRFKKVIYENASNPYCDRKLELMEEERILVNERSEWVNRFNYVSKYLELLEKKDLNMITELWIIKKKPESVWLKYNYSKEGMYKRIDTALQKIIKKN